MDDLLKAFTMGAPIQRKVISGGSTNGRIATEYETPNYKEDKVPERTIKYAKPFVNKIRDEVWGVSTLQLYKSNAKSKTFEITFM